jgi:hypothetical protein
MLFSFPRTGYVDGMYIKKGGTYQRVKDCKVEPLDFFTEPNTKYMFSNGWRINIRDVKEEEYLIKLIIDGQFNVFFFELSAGVINKEGERIGYCVVELLPGQATNGSSLFWCLKEKPCAQNEKTVEVPGECWNVYSKLDSYRQFASSSISRCIALLCTLNGCIYLINITHQRDAGPPFASCFCGSRVFYAEIDVI